MAKVERMKVVDPFSRGLPSHPDYERWILGCVQSDNTEWPRVVAVLDANDFSLESHRRIFEAIKAVALRGDPLDYVSTALELSKRGHLESVGGSAYIVSLTDGLPELMHLESYLRIIRDDSLRRKLAFVMQKGINEALVSGASTEEVVGWTLSQVQDLKASTLPALSMDNLREPGASAKPLSYVIAPELPGGSVVAFTGESGCGKSTLMTAYARDAMVDGHPVLVLDRENPESVIVERLARLGVVNGPLLVWWGGWNDSEAPEPAAEVIQAWVRARSQPGMPAPLVIVDNLSAFHAGDENEAEQMRAFMNQSRALANLGACVVVLHNTGKSETAKEYRGSSDFKASVDQLFVVRNNSQDSNLDRLVVKCYKSRYGFAGSITYSYADGKFLRDDRAHPEAISSAEILTSILRVNPGIGVRKMISVAASKGVSERVTKGYLENGVLSHSIERQKGSRNEYRHFLVTE